MSDIANWIESQGTIKKKKKRKIKVLNKDVEDVKEVKKDNEVKVKKLTREQKTENQVLYTRNEDLLPKVEIEFIEYGIMSKESIEGQKVCDIENKYIVGNSSINTPHDPRLGTIEFDRQCSTCFKSENGCPGHLGILRLPEYIIHPLFRVQVLQVLQSVCNSCGSILITPQDIISEGINSFSGSKRLAKISSVSVRKRCLNKKCPLNPVFKPADLKDNNKINFIGTTGRKENEKQVIYEVIYIKKIFDNISKSDIATLGFVGNMKPSDYIVDFIPVIPPQARPYIINNCIRTEDHITRFYDHVMDARERYFYSDDRDSQEPRNEIHKILYYYSHMINNQYNEYRSTNSDIVKDISKRLARKEGLLRGNLLGKRTDFSGRSILGPNRNLRFGQIAVPRVMRSVLTTPEVITIYNIDRIRKLADEGKIAFFELNSNNHYKMRHNFNRKNYKDFIHLGVKVDRFSEDGDIILFNRQPTLQKQSMLGYNIVHQDRKTIGLHLSSTTGHNADFDGDEGNIHHLQLVESQVEGRVLMTPEKNIMSFQYSAPDAGLVYNAITGGYLLSDPDLIFSEKIFNEGLKIIGKTSLRKYPKKSLKRNSGRLLCSMLFPEDFFYYKKIVNDYEEVNEILIRNGFLLSGRFTKKVIGGSSGSIIQSLWKQYDWKVCSDFISDANFLFNWYLELYGLTVNLKDCYPVKDFKVEIDEMLDDINTSIQSLPKLPENSSEWEFDKREDKIISLIENKKSKVIEKIKKNISDDNAIATMSELKSGAKGNKSVWSIWGFLGQEFINNKRPSLSISNGKRWCSTFNVRDESVQARGFIKNNLTNGLDPDEYFVHGQSTRIGLIALNLKTADIGYTQRKMARVQEDLIVKNDGSVRNSNNFIFQLSYSGGFSASEMVRSGDLLSFINIPETVNKINSKYVKNI